MKALILYFSGTGNTKYVVYKISTILKELNCETEIHSIEEKFEIKPNTFDMLILGCPKYYEYPVVEFIQYIKRKLPVNTKTIPAMFFCTQVAQLETNYNEADRILRNKNYKLIVSKSFPIANNMVIFNSFPLTEPEKRQENLDRLDQELKPLIVGLIKRKSSKEKPNCFFGIITFISGYVCTKLFSLFAVKYSASDSCTGCGLCVRKCPKKNISLHHKRPKFGNKCIFCMRCINICPKNAILYNKKVCNQYKPIEIKKSILKEFK